MEETKLLKMNVRSTDVFKALTLFSLFGALISLMFVSLSGTHATSNNISQKSAPSVITGSSTYSGELEYTQSQVDAVGYINGIATAHATLDTAFKVTYYVYPNGEITEDFNYVNPQENTWYTYSPVPLGGTSTNNGNTEVSTVTYTSSGVPTITVNWDPVFTVDNTPWSSVQAAVLFHERVYGNGDETGQALVNSNLEVSWESIANAVIDFGGAFE